MSRAAVDECVQSASPKTEFPGLRSVGVMGAQMTNGAAVWAHAGILYRWKKELRLFELKTHRKLSDEPIKHDSTRPVVVWVEPKLPPERAALIGAKCQLVFRCHSENTLPYAFRYSRTTFDERGMLHLAPGDVGLTCATIVDAVFASEGRPLVDPSQWPKADEDDKKSRQTVIAAIRKQAHEHADALEAEIDAPRIRPEEVVAAAAIHPAVGTFDTLVDGAAVVAGKLGL